MKLNSVIIAVSVLFSLVMSSCASAPETQPSASPEWAYNAVVYEMNVRQQSEEGSFAAAEARLPFLKELGVDIIWLMPIHPIGVEERKGTLGSYYSIVDYKAINPEFGTLEDFKSFLDAAHELGFKVIIDWVANHTSRDAKWWQEGKKDWYKIDPATDVPIVEYDWTDIASLNYENADMRAAMTEALCYWVELGIDGYRCDVAYKVPADFWQEAWTAVKNINPDVYLLAEGEESWLHECGFNASYAWELHHLMNAMAKGGSETKNVAGDGTIKTDAKSTKDLKEYIARDAQNYPREAMRLMFTSNHDENSWAGTEFERLGDAVKTMAALTYVLPQGQPLIYTGQEIGYNDRFEFFEKDPVLSWEANEWTDFYKALNAMRHSNLALGTGERGGEIVLFDVNNDSVLAFSREVADNKVVCLFNLSAEEQKIQLAEPFEGYKCALSGESVSLGTEAAMAPWHYYIIVK